MSMPAFITGGQRGGRRGAAETVAWTPGKHTSGSPPGRRSWVAFGVLALALAGGDPDASEFFTFPASKPDFTSLELSSPPADF